MIQQSERKTTRSSLANDLLISSRGISELKIKSLIKC